MHLVNVLVAVQNVLVPVLSNVQRIAMNHPAPAYVVDATEHVEPVTILARLFVQVL